MRKGCEEAKAERERRSEALLKQTEQEREKVVSECRELRAFLEEKEQVLLGRLEQLQREVTRRRDEALERLLDQMAQLDKLLQQSQDGGTAAADSAVTAFCL
ncbi:tripartite motif-containing protein 7-like [Columba livia]|uniref:Tripartite motif-containing protein 7-like n=1 Tax=Columba livia TaxID=8932 RepID=A0A2I0LI64_COLLI|nr:tripartite motif-containing protein 7-like [Columba livia]